MCTPCICIHGTAVAYRNVSVDKLLFSPVNSTKIHKVFHPFKTCKPTVLSVLLCMSDLYEYANSISLGGEISGAHIAPASSV